ncbi:hypothetical protein V5O48_010940 [Marasmius crinis-equi]|uniref:F-box domain-containing protein n=1 Tax=Marasmius crinis-equi TaxID=585013 RepID=A0ABR3F7H3_9AGAR
MTSDLRTILCQRCNNDFIVPFHPDIPIELLRSSSIAEPEISAQRQLLTSESQSLIKYDEEIDRIASALQKLESERSALRERILHRRSFLLSQARIPLEIWGHIFTEVCYQDKAAMFYDQPVSFISARFDYRLRSVPLLLSQVCSHWRQILLNLPSIWAHADITLPYLTPSRLTKLGSLLTNARGYPLTLLIHGSLGHRDDDFTSQIRMFLCEAFARSKHIGLHLHLLSSFDFQNRLSFPILQSLTVASFGGSDDSHFGSIPQVDAFFAPPSLTRLWLTDVMSVRGEALPSALLSFTQGRAIGMDGLKCLAVHFPGLRNLTICFSGSKPYRGQPLIFPRLQSLKIEERSLDPFAVLNNITVPSLTDLTLSLAKSISQEGGSLSDACVSSLIGCLRRSACALRTLDLIMPEDDLLSRGETQISDFFLLSASLTSFSFTMKLPPECYDDLSDSTPYILFSLFTLPSPSNTGGRVTLLPSLQTLNVRIERFPQKEDDIAMLAGHFLRMAESRAKGTTPAHVATLDSAILVLDGETYMPSTSLGDTRYRITDEYERRRDALLKGGVRCSIDVGGITRSHTTSSSPPFADGVGDSFRSVRLRA